MAKKQILNQKSEIIWNIVNAGLAGGLVFLGALSTRHVDLASIGAAGAASLIVIITKFSAYWQKEKKEYQSKIFNFVGGV